MTLPIAHLEISKHHSRTSVLPVLNLNCQFSAFSPCSLCGFSLGPHGLVVAPCYTILMYFELLLHILASVPGPCTSQQ